MKMSVLISMSLLAVMPLAHAQARAPQPAAVPPPPPPPPPVYPAVTAPQANVPVYVYDQKPAGGRSYLIAPEQAQSIIARFKDEYKKLGNPRVVIYVNRDLVDENSGLKLSSHRQVIESTRASADPASAPANPPAENSNDNLHRTERVSSTNIYRMRDHTAKPLADRQTSRDVERLFGRPLRMAGVELADQAVATQLIGSRTLDSFSAESEQARKDREALSTIADVVLEILVSSKEAPVTELSGDAVYSAPDIQATAIRLKDAKILGQATAADLIGQGPAAARAMRTYGVREISEATALSLMEDIMLH